MNPHAHRIFELCSLPQVNPQTCRFASGPPRGLRKLGNGPAFSQEGAYASFEAALQEAS
jgi:hypothetical protein